MSNKMENILSPAMKTSLLPQYRMSVIMDMRFIDAIHNDEPIIERSKNNKGIKEIDNSELITDALNYFIKNKSALSNEFISELSRKVSKDEIDLFCKVVAEDWFDGMKKRNSGRPHNLKSSVYSYINTIYGETCASSCVQKDELPNKVPPLISDNAIASILTVNNQMLYKHIEEWKNQHPKGDQINSDDIFIRRGISLTTPINEGDKYLELDYISSYSLAISAPEKFSQNSTHGSPAIINGELSLFTERVLFFSPFIPNMDPLQLEFGIIPSEKPLEIHDQGEHGGIREYILEPAQYQI